MTTDDVGKPASRFMSARIDLQFWSEYFGVGVGRMPNGAKFVHDCDLSPEGRKELHRLSDHHVTPAISGIRWLGEKGAVKYASDNRISGSDSPAV